MKTPMKTLTPETIQTLRSLLAQATPGPWAVWDGPQYAGGGRDLCIGAGENRLANMDHFYGESYDERVAHDSALGAERHVDGCPICSFTDEVDAKQKATADLIVGLFNAAPELLDCAEILHGDPQEYLTRHGLDAATVNASLEELTEKVRSYSELLSENERLRAALEEIAEFARRIAKASGEDVPRVSVCWFAQRAGEALAAEKTR